MDKPPLFRLQKEILFVFKKYIPLYIHGERRFLSGEERRREELQWSKVWKRPLLKEATERLGDVLQPLMKSSSPS
ncbi:hypothetical protein EYF80_045536 [Liparis tanakae]|uniref:Uncharacterized protein n=1 Tax=Liparis tanakae TaxID=230148 RepID=A0A4Z2FU01_9TELE|nr:hypothetical protein EYF80_045536 [Liparis tanakae]